MGTHATANMSAAVVASVQETGLTASQFDTIYNVTSFGLACMMASTCFFFFLQGGSLLHRPRDLHRILPLLPYLQLLRCCFHPMRGRRGCRQPQQVLPNRVRLLPNWPCFQRCLPLHGLAPDRAPAPDRDRARDEAVPRRDQEAEPAPRRPLRPHDPQRLPRRELW